MNAQPTLKQLAKHLNLSITQVSRAMGGFPDVSADTRLRVQQAARELGYVPNAGAQRLQKQRTDTLGLVLPIDGTRFTDPFFSELIAGIGSEATRLGYDLLLSAQPPGDGEVAFYERLVQARRVDGLLIVRTRVDDQRIRFLAAKRFPFVAYGLSELNMEYPYVGVDSYAGFCQAAEHLLELGHRRIGFVDAPPEFTFAHHRRAAYLDTLSHHGIAADHALIVQGDLTHGGGYAAGMQLLKREPPPTAIMAANDLMALGVISAVQKCGYVVGRDIAVLGFDGIALGDFAHPPLTTVAQPVQQITRHITELLVQIIRGEVVNPEPVILQPTLIVRESTMGSGHPAPLHAEPTLANAARV